MSLPGKVLFVAPNPYFRMAREDTLRRAGYAVTSFPSTADALRALCSDGDGFDILIVCDCTPAAGRGQLIAIVKATSPHTPVLVIGNTRDRLADGVVSDLDGPEALLDHVAGLLFS